jgi:hypothetical protein
MTQETSIVNLHVYKITQSPTQSHGTKFREQMAKSHIVRGLDSHILLRNMVDTHSSLWHQHTFRLPLFFLPIRICNCGCFL